MEHLLNKLQTRKLMITLCLAVLMTGPIACASDGPKIRVTVGSIHDNCVRQKVVTYDRNDDYEIRRREVISDDHKYCDGVVVERREVPRYHVDRCDRDTRVVEVVRKRPIVHVRVISKPRHYEKRIIVTQNNREHNHDHNKYNNRDRQHNKHNRHENHKRH